MKNIKKSELTELLKSKGLAEGFIDRIFNRLQKSKTDSQLKQIEKEIEKSKEKVKKIDSEQKQLLIKTYGSLDKVPDFMLKKFSVKK